MHTLLVLAATKAPGLENQWGWAWMGWEEQGGEKDRDAGVEVGKGTVSTKAAPSWIHMVSPAQGPP